MQDIKAKRGKRVFFKAIILIFALMLISITTLKWTSSSTTVPCCEGPSVAGCVYCSGTTTSPPVYSGYCGDGHKDTPNSNGQFEQCDNGIDGNGVNEICLSDCTLNPDCIPPETEYIDYDTYAYFYGDSTGCHIDDAAVCNNGDTTLRTDVVSDVFTCYQWYFQEIILSPPAHR